MVVDDRMEVVVPERLGLVLPTLAAVAGDGVAGPSKAWVALDVHVQQVARTGPLVADERLARGSWSARAAVALEDGMDGGVRDAGLAGDQSRTPAGALTSSAHPRLDVGRRATWRAMRPA
jgi:hypothetical protein